MPRKSIIFGTSRACCGVVLSKRGGKKSKEITHTEKVLRGVIAGIRDGTISPGERLDEVGLSKRFGVSRTPVREALQHVVAAGLAVRRPHCGVFVAPSPEEGEMRELHEALHELRQACVRLGGGNRFLAEAAQALEQRLERARG